jgi:hypothetical protein
VIVPVVVCPENVPTTFAAVPPGVRVRVFPPVTTLNESPVTEGADEKVPTTAFGVPPFVTVRTEAPFVIVTAPAGGWAEKVPPLVAAVPALAVNAVPLTVTALAPPTLEPLNVPVWLAAIAAAPATFSPKTTKSVLQLGPWLTSKLNLAGDICGATPELALAPKDRFQSPWGVVPAGGGFFLPFPLVVLPEGAAGLITLGLFEPARFRRDDCCL